MGEPEGLNFLQQANQVSEARARDMWTVLTLFSSTKNFTFDDYIRLEETLYAWLSAGKVEALEATCTWIDLAADEMIAMFQLFHNEEGVWSVGVLTSTE